MLYGSGSDADGTIASYSWTKISGPSGGNIVTANTAATTIYNLAQGTYQFEITVTDNNGATAKDVVNVIVTGAVSNTPPVANAGGDITIYSPANSTPLYGSGTDPDGTISSYRWAQVSGANAKISGGDKATASISNLQGIGSYVFSLTVTDNAGATGIDYITVTVASVSNISPIANAGSNITITTPSTAPLLTEVEQIPTAPLLPIYGRRFPGLALKLLRPKAQQLQLLILSPLGTMFLVSP